MAIITQKLVKILDERKKFQPVIKVRVESARGKQYDVDVKWGFYEYYCGLAVSPKIYFQTVDKMWEGRVKNIRVNTDGWVGAPIYPIILETKKAFLVQTDEDEGFKEDMKEVGKWSLAGYWIVYKTPGNRDELLRKLITLVKKHFRLEPIFEANDPEIFHFDKLI